MSIPPPTPADSESVYHLELRQFPHNLCRFNLSGGELRVTILEPWAADRWVELEERKWDPRQAKLTVLEGPRIAPAQLSMGRGWRTAQRQGRDVTTQLLAEVAEALARGPGAEGAPGPAGSAEPVAPARTAGAGEGSRVETVSGMADLVADSLGLELLSRMGGEQSPLRCAWELAGTRGPSGPASDALALAERAVASLLRAGLIVLLRGEGSRVGTEAGVAHGDAGEDRGDALQAPAGAEVALHPVEHAEAERILGAIESWIGGRGAAQVWIRRA
jgi:hypothetical protein